MIFVVDTATVDAARVQEYLDALGTQVVPLMIGAGATLDTCRTTDAGLGRPVEVQTTWSCAGYEAWNEIRRALVLDPRYYASAAALDALRQGGTRRFHTAVSLAPAAPS